ncbi:methyl-accepting chemotaxis protein [Oceanospirillum maris]|uniref:methyl-accepting chemotaxis protein n=1 Tax=Oceanospirillum maris TaxID=64977 RepID=UPI00040B7858|nr:methyl-accepting chemotaxis protein [Oceanospirillum maris]
MFTQLRLAQQLAIGFGVLILFSVVLTLFSYKGLSESSHGVQQYRGFVADTNIASHLQSSMLMQGADVQSYLIHQEQGTLEHYQKQEKEVAELILTAKSQFKDPKRLALIEDIEVQIAQFQQAFDQVKVQIGLIDRITEQQLYPAGFEIRKTMTTLIENAYLNGVGDTIFYAASVQEHLLLGRLYANRYLISRKKEHYDRAVKELDDIMPNALTLLKNALDGEDSELLTHFEANHQAFLVSLEKVYRSASQVSKITQETIIPLSVEITVKTNQIKQDILKDQEQVGPKLQQDIENLTDLILFVSAIVVIAGIVFTVVMLRVIKQPIGGEPRDIAAITRQIASGNLNIKHQENSTGILQSVGHMAEQLRTIIASITRTGSQLQDTAQSASAVAQQTHAVVNEQQSRIEQIAAAVTEMAASIHDVVGHSESSAQAATTGMDYAIQGKETVQQTLAAINDLAENVEKSVETIQSLEASSTNIGSVTEVIQTISEQTNLLALNAAIEAARAGESGRGFAVVADEVRNLAQRSQDSAQTIQDMINQLQSDINHAVETMLASRDKVLNTVEQSEKTGIALDTIVESIRQISEMNAQVVTAVSQQSSVAEEISFNITAVTQLSDQTVEGALQTADASRELSQISKELVKTVDHFKL